MTLAQLRAATIKNNAVRNATEQRYWIQEFNAPGSNWVDYVGMDERTTIEEALADIKVTRHAWSHPKRVRQFRLVVRKDAVIA